MFRYSDSMLNQEEMRKIIQALNITGNINFTNKHQSFKEHMRKYYGFEGCPENDVIAWCAIFLKEMLPDIEIYVDKLAIGIASRLRMQGMLDEKTFIEHFIAALDISLLHEIIHLEGKTKDEDQVNAMCEAVARHLAFEVNMGWTYIPCPATGGYVTFEQCVECDDLKKHPQCPLQKIRQDAHDSNRQYTLGRYHVSEVIKPRYAFYERQHATTRGWDDYWAMFLGKAIGYFIEGRYPDGDSEYEFEVKLSDVVALLGRESEPEDEEIVILGHADIADHANKLLLELKTMENLKYVKEGAKPEHIFQTQAYYTLGRVQEPEMFDNLNGARIVYISRARGYKRVPRYIEHKVEMELLDFVDAARTLHNAVKSDKAPPATCPDWLCRYCGHGGNCRADE